MKMSASFNELSKTHLQNALQNLQDVLIANFVYGQHEEEQSTAINLTQRIYETSTRKHCVDQLHVMCLVRCLQALKNHYLRNENSTIYWADAVRHAVLQVTKQLMQNKK